MKPSIEAPTTPVCSWRCRFISDFKSSLFFVLIFSLVDFGVSAFLPTKIPANAVSRLIDGGVLAILASFALRLVIAYFVVALIFSFILFVFKVKKRLWFFFLVTHYILIYDLLKSPQLFDEFKFLIPVIRFVVANLNVSYLVFSSAAVLVFLIFSYIKDQTGNKSSMRMGVTQALDLALAVLAGIGICYYFGWLQPLLKISDRSSYARAESPPIYSNQRRKNVIVISVDSAIPGFLNAPSRESAKEFDGFVKSSVQFDNAITPVAQSHASLTSLFTAQSPLQTKVRENLAMQALNTDSLLSGSVVESFKKSGFDTSLMMDARDFAYFDPGYAFDRTTGPKPGLEGLLLPHVFRSRFFFALLDNPLGFLFLPDLRANANFDGYNPGHYTQDVIKEIRRLASEPGRSHLLIAHGCLMHWPGSHIYPYYPKTGFVDNSRAQYSYVARGDFLGKWKASDNRKPSIEFDKKIYRLGIDLAKDQFLEPVFNELKQDGLLDDSAVVLISDHGENLWDENSRFPRTIIPSHGNSLTFSSGSERATLMMKIPGITSEKISDSVGIIDILPTLAEWADVKTEHVEGTSFYKQLLRKETWDLWKKSYYSETGAWTSFGFNGQLTYANSQQFYNIFNIEPKSHRVFIDPRQESVLIVQKQRAIIFDNYRFSIYPTLSGYRIFVCDFKIDPNCSKNLFRNLSENLIVRAIRAFNDETILDQKKNFFPRFPEDSRSKSTSNLLPSTLEQDNILENLRQLRENAPNSGSKGLLLYRSAVEIEQRFGDAKFSTEIIEALLSNNSVSEDIKTLSKNLELGLCGAGTYTQSTLPGFLKLEFKKNHDVSPHSAIDPYLRVCARELGIDDPRWNMNRVTEGLAEQIPSHVIVNDWFSENELERIAKNASRGSSNYLSALSYLAAMNASNSRGKSFLEEAVSNAAFRSSLIDLQIAQVLVAKNGDVSSARGQLDQLISEEKEYGLVEEMNSFYNMLFEAESSRSKESALLLAMEDLDRTQLPLQYFNRLIKLSTEDLRKSKTELNEITQLEFAFDQTTRLSAHKSPLDFHEIKSVLAMRFISERLCRSASEANSCKKSLEILARSAKVREWRSLGSALLSDRSKLLQLIEKSN